MSPSGEDQQSSTSLWDRKSLIEFVKDVFSKDDQIEVGMEWAGPIDGKGAMDVVITIPDVELGVN